MSIGYLIETYGYAAVFLLVGAEGLGIPVPGETALIVAGTYAGHSHHLNPVTHLGRGVRRCDHRVQHRLLGRRQGRLPVGSPVRALGPPRRAQAEDRPLCLRKSTSRSLSSPSLPSPVCCSWFADRSLSWVSSPRRLIPDRSVNDDKRRRDGGQLREGVATRRPACHLRIPNPTWKLGWSAGFMD